MQVFEKKIIVLIVLFCTANLYSEIIGDTIITKDGLIIHYKKYSSDKKLQREWSTLNGQPNGVETEWYPDGTKKTQNKYIKGVLVDSSYGYYSNGKIESIVICNHDGSECRSIAFSENGDTLSLGFSKNHHAIGTFKSFYRNKQPFIIEHYNDSGKKHGLCETWREDGTRRDSVVYNNGEFVEERVYFANGNVRYHLVYGDKVKVRRVCYAGSIDTLDELTVANATFYSFKNGKILSSIKKGKGLATWCDSIGNNCSTETYLWGIEIETEKKICARPKNAGPSALPEKGKCDCWVDVVGKVEK